MNFLGFDIGTSAVKAVLVDADQRAVAAVSIPLATQRPRPLWSEQNPEAWWIAVERCVAELRAANPSAWSGVAAIGLSGQMHGPVLLDEHHEIIRPAILWNDGRAYEQALALQEMVPGIGQIAGAQPTAGLTAPKLLWLARHEQHNFGRICHVLAPKDYVRFRMTGELVTDMCDAAGMLWLDVAKRDWSRQILDAIGLDAGCLPRLMEGPQISGSLRQSWGLSSVMVAAGSGDAAAGAVGVGAVSDGDAFVSIGTSAQYFITTASYRPSPNEFIHAFAHALPGRWSQSAAPLNGASCLAWAAALIRGSSIAELLAEAERSFSGPSPLLFLPYLSGERMPYNDPKAKGVLFGLTPGVEASQIVLAVIEGVAFSLADAQDSLTRAGTTAKSLGVTGGGARSRFWMRLLSAILNRPLDLDEGAERGPAFGAARLARMAVSGEAAEIVCTRAEMTARIDPDPRLVDAYEPRLSQFRTLYQALSSEFNND